MPQKPTIPFTCPVCGRTVLVTKQSAKSRRVCSRECTAASRRHPLPEKRLPPNRICEVCGRPFHAKPAYVGRFCSNRCRGFGSQMPIIFPDAETDLAYMAGIIDGEGTITIGTSGSPRLLVANSSMLLMEWIVATFGGRMQTPRATRKPNHKPVISWYCSADQTVALCRLLLPCLKVKRLQADLILAWRDTTDRVVALKLIRALNRRGLA